MKKKIFISSIICVLLLVSVPCISSINILKNEDLKLSNDLPKFFRKNGIYWINGVSDLLVTADGEIIHPLDLDPWNNFTNVEITGTIKEKGIGFAIGSRWSETLDTIAFLMLIFFGEILKYEMGENFLNFIYALADIFGYRLFPGDQFLLKMTRLDEPFYDSNGFGGTGPYLDGKAQNLQLFLI
jgi:hypothetical protein